MKITRYFLWIWMTLVLVALTGCQTNSEVIHDTQLVKGRLVVQSQNALENEVCKPSTFIEDTKSNNGETLMYKLEVWTREAQARRVLQKTVNGSLTSGVQFEIALIPGIYDFLLWADYGNGHYITTNLRQVTVTTDSYRPKAQNDAFACALKQVEWNGNTIFNATLKRPVARMSIQNDNVFNQSNTVSIIYGEIYTLYDVLTGEVSAPRKDLTVSFPETTIDSQNIGEDFLFVPATGSMSSLSISVGDITKTVDDVQLKSNYNTNITCSF